MLMKDYHFLQMDPLIGKNGNEETNVCVEGWECEKSIPFFELSCDPKTDLNFLFSEITTQYKYLAWWLGLQVGRCCPIPEQPSLMSISGS